MFSKQWKARIEQAAIGMTRIKREERKALAVTLIYAFTDKLAEAIGGDAPVAQEVLARAGESKCKVHNQKLVMDTSTVKLVISASKDDKLSVSSTYGMMAKAKRPTKEGGTDPVLMVKVGWRCDDDEELDGAMEFLQRHVGETLNVRMDRKQLELLPQPVEEATEATEA
jgi:hypothetical protein